MQNVEAHPQAKLRHSQKEAVVQSGKNERHPVSNFSVLQSVRKWLKNMARAFWVPIFLTKIVCNGWYACIW